MNRSFLKCLPGEHGLDWIIGFLWPAFNGIACANRVSSLVARDVLKRCFSAALGEDATVRLGVSWDELRCAFSWRPQVIIVGGCDKPRELVRYRLCGDGSGGFPFESKLITSIHPSPDYYSFKIEFSAAYCEGFVYATSDANYLAYLFRFNVASGTWDDNFEPAFPEDLSDNASFGGTGLVANGSDFFLAGGSFSADNRAVLKFKTRTNSFHRLAPLNIDRSQAGMASLPNALFIAGGESSETQCSVETYSFVDNLWTRVADMKWKRDSPSMFVASGRIYVVGGIPWDLDDEEDFPNREEFLTAIEVFDAEQNEWNEVGSSQFWVNNRLTAVSLSSNQIASFDGTSESLITLDSDSQIVQSCNVVPCIDGHGYCWSRAVLTSCIQWIDK